MLFIDNKDSVFCINFVCVCVCVYLFVCCCFLYLFVVVCLFCVLLLRVGWGSGGGGDSWKTCDHNPVSPVVVVGVLAVWEDC